MGRGIMIVFAFAMTLVFIAGCATPEPYLKGKEKLEAGDWLHAGDIAYQLKDWDNAQYYYDLLVKKYPDSYYGKKAKENLGYINYQRSLIGKAVGKGTEELEPIF
ncbi:MAG: hypothetical protein PHX64_00480 [Candidatus Omnitrophica bacterium]|nr:hypothetical protein [Candidatus Omnitrophota bacterium]MDD5310215.1 hypothetical protein [Candidatus Omnitrophota bacterium]MDD5546207.1 hypothetical protein [Candidatus Omnitrophota bacterium]